MAQKPKFVFFQRWRIFLFGMKAAAKTGFAKSEAERKAYKEIATLAANCLQACNERQQAKMIAQIDTLLQPKVPEKSMLDALIDGTHEDLPEWLRK